MTEKFVNREKELAILEQEIKKSKLIVIFGRRRVGKTRLLREWAKNFPTVYTQAIEGVENLQLEQAFEDLKSLLPTNIAPVNWFDYFDLLSLVKEELVLVIDEFPYLVNSNSSLPSIMQKWIDHKQPDNIHLLLSGSSQSMMHNIFLDQTAPLFERADRLIHLKPMNYKYFTEYLGIDPLIKESFILFSIIGGIPRYWEYIDTNKNYIEVIDDIFFSEFPRFDSEPYRLLKDENIKGIQAISILESIGRGAAKPSEIAKKLGIPQTSLGRPLKLLMDVSIVSRELPFGESIRNTKRVLYHITDYMLRFWYTVYSPHRSRWHLYSNKNKKNIILPHVAYVLEQEFRKLYKDASRYWEKQIVEFDSVRFADETLKTLIISEIKWADLAENEKIKIKKEMKEKYEASKLPIKYKNTSFEVMTWRNIASLLIR